MRAVALALLALLASACVGSYSRAVEETRAGLVGLSARDLRRCLGAPTDVEMLEGVEQQTYRFTRDRDPWLASGSGGWGPVTVQGHGNAGSGGFDTGKTSAAPAWCQLDFELRDGAVAEVRADGRDAQGMNAAGACMLEARRCIPYEDEEPE